MPDLVTALLRAAHRWPERPAWTFDPGESLTFGEVGTRVEVVAGALHDSGVRRRDRVAVVLDNRAAFPLTWLALARLGAAMVPINTAYRAADAMHVLDRSRSSAVVTSAALAEHVEAAVAGLAEGAPRLLMVEDLPGASTPAPADHPSPPAHPAHLPAAEDTVNVQYTSGTTGRPKGCVLSHRYWLELGGGLLTEFPYLTEHDTLLTAQAFSYVDPQWNVVAAMLAGAHLVVLDRFHPSTFWAKVREHAVTYFYCLAAMPTLLLATPPHPGDRDHAVRAVQCSAIPPARHAEIEERWGVPWYEAFGMTETGGDMRVTDADHDALVGTGCLGRPVRAREVRVVDVAGRAVPRGDSGEIVLRGPGLMDGYDDDPAATAEAFRGGWFHTGDLGRMDDGGRVYLTGRVKDMVRRAGENVSAREVEDVLVTHPAVGLAAVVAVPDDLRGEEVKAFLTLTVVDRNARDVLEEVAAHCRDRLARFKVPRYWEVRAELPLTASHRVAKTELEAVPGRTWDLAEEVWV